MAADRWSKELPIAITVCDTEGIIIEMNDRSIETFIKDGGAALMGSNVLDCHPEPSRTQLRNMLEHATPNIYTIEKNGKKKLICQAPWKQNGVYSGFVELSIDLPDQLSHFVRDP
ncbi:MAG: diguanylate cyclase [Ignavibacteria bacterium]|nr:diguanylate cyclase [Ignavibacteria bacterium]